MEGRQAASGGTDSRTVGFRIEKADAGDYQTFADIIQTVWRGLDKKEWFVADNAEYTYEMLTTGKGIGYKAVDINTDKVAGVFLVTKPGDSGGNLGRDAGLGDGELPLVAHMESVAVLPEYRGHRLQYRLMQEAEKDLKESGFKYLMCTVHPDNGYSRNNVMGQGYRSVVVKEKYGGYRREVFLKEI